MQVVLYLNLPSVLRLVLDDGEKLFTLASLALLSHHTARCDRCRLGILLRLLLLVCSRQTGRQPRHRCLHRGDVGQVLKFVVVPGLGWLCCMGLGRGNLILGERLWMSRK